MDTVEPVHASELVLRALNIGSVGSKLGTFLNNEKIYIEPTVSFRDLDLR